MKITVLFGDDVEKSRARFGKIIDGVRTRGWDVIKVGENENLVDALSSQLLIDGGSLYVLDDIKKIQKQDLDWLSKNDEVDVNLLVWHKGAGLGNLKQSLPRQTRYESFELPKQIFQFCESVWPGNSEGALKSFHEVLKTEPAELVLAMLARQLRDVWIAKNDLVKLAYPDWRVRKIRQQADRYEKRQLNSVIAQLAKADVDSKTGGVDLLTSLDLLLAVALE